ncbi:hypothetical protein GCM10020000_06350 [Streptomyces olivoverticillatus]
MAAARIPEVNGAVSARRITNRSATSATSPTPCASHRYGRDGERDQMRGHNGRNTAWYNCGATMVTPKRNAGRRNGYVEPLRSPVSR